MNNANTEALRSSAPYGFCPICGANGITRERRPDGNDRCSAGHTYPSRDSVGEVKQAPPAKCPTCGRPNTAVGGPEPSAGRGTQDGLVGGIIKGERNDNG